MGRRFEPARLSTFPKQKTRDAVAGYSVDSIFESVYRRSQYKDCYRLATGSCGAIKHSPASSVLTSLLFARAFQKPRLSVPMFGCKESIARLSLVASLLLHGGLSDYRQFYSLGEGAKEPQRQPRQIPPPTDVDPKLTEEFRQLEQQLCDAILHKDAKILDSLVGPDYTLRVADIPQSSLPRAIWMDNTLNKRKAESCEQRFHAGRKLADDIGVVSLIWAQRATTDGRDISADFYVVDFWKRTGADWQIIARYSSPVGKTPDRPPRQLPPASDSDPQLTDLLRKLEQKLNEAALHRFKDTKTMERIVSPEFTQRVSDAPERSLPRSLWGQPTDRYKIGSIDGRHHAARKLSEDLAVVSWLLTQRATCEGRDRSGDFYVVDIWKKSGERWQLIARYSSPVGKKFERTVPP